MPLGMILGGMRQDLCATQKICYKSIIYVASVALFC